MNELKHELSFLKALIKKEKGLKTLKRGWNKQYLKRILGLYLILDILLSFLFLLPLSYFFEDYFNTYNDVLEEPVELILIGCLLLPFIEELIFRWPLVYNEKHIKLFLYGISIICLPIYWPLGLTLLVLSFLAASKNWEQLKSFSPKKIHERYVKPIFWFSVIGFGLVHITNYDFESIPIYVYPLMVVPQLIGGLTLGIIRIRFGLRYAILQHSLFNLILTCASFIFE